MKIQEINNAKNMIGRSYYPRGKLIRSNAVKTQLIRMSSSPTSNELIIYRLID